MASSFNSGLGSNPAEQVAQSWRSVSEALKAAGEQSAERNKEISLVVIKQAEKNAADLFNTLQAIAGARNPSDIYKLYSKYLSDSVSSHAEQLKEITEVLAKSGKDAWEPITRAVQQATTPKV
jgi:hypothetical protein